MSKSNTSSGGLGFVRRVYPARVLGLPLGALVAVSVLQLQATSTWTWAALAANALLWPHLAYWLALRSPNPAARERLHLLVDSAAGGVWVAAMGFSPLATALVLMMLWMNNIAAGGLRLFTYGLSTTALGLLGGLLVFGWQLQLTTPQSVIYAALPLLVAYPLLIGSITYRFAMQLHRQKELLKRLSRTDGLTGLFNRSYWEERVCGLMTQSRRNQQALCLVMLDVDHFKSVNDTWGHGTGDQILVQIARKLQSSLREQELLCRYGGEEFALVLPNTTLDAAVVTAERLRATIAASEFRDPHSPELHALKCTISLGIALWRADMEDYMVWQRAADKALYRAKAQGRNCTYVHLDAGEDQLVIP